MELQFQKTSISCLHQLARQVQNQEQTQEVKLPEGMPDIGRVLGAWGQVMIRGKEWRTDSLSVSCGCLVWVLYAPEDGSPAQSLETWIPFNLSWDMPQTDRDGVFLADCLLRSVDARAISGRKLMVRASVGVMAEAYTTDMAELAVAYDLPEDIRIKKSTYPVQIPKEAGEKPFIIDEDLVLPQSCQPLEKLIRYDLLPEVTERRVMTDKVIFRGTALLHTLYRGQDGDFHTWDFEIPFSQYAELEQSYGHEASARISPAVTNLEMDAADGHLRLKAGLTGQYVICDKELIEVAEDAYSLMRPVTVQQEFLALPAVLDETQQTVGAESTVNQSASRIVDVAFYPDQPQKRHQAEEVIAELSGMFQVLYYDEDDMLQCSTARWEGNMSMAAADNADVAFSCRPAGTPQAIVSGDTITPRGMTAVVAVTGAPESIVMVTGLLVGDTAELDPNRPSVILRRAGDDCLWDIAKQSGSTVEAILQANGLQGEPSPDKMLLIPIS